MPYHFINRGISNPLKFYTTNFPLTENPISESGAWVSPTSNWTPVRTAGGLAFGTQTIHGTPPFDDSIACLQGFAANHYAEAVIHSASPGTQEVELFTRASFSNTVSRGVETDILSGGDFDVVHWGGALNDFMVIDSGIVSGVSVADGAVFRVTQIGAIMTVYCNTVQVYTKDIQAWCAANSRTYWATGNPGMGMYDPVDGGNNKFAFSRFTASDI